MDELRSFEATRQGSPPPPTSSLKGMRGKRGSSQSQDSSGAGAGRLTGAPGAGGWGRGPQGQAHPTRMTPSPPPAPQAGISAPSSRRGQTEAAIGHLRFEGDKGRELPRSIWEAAGRREGGCVGRASALLLPPTSLAQLKAAKRLD